MKKILSLGILLVVILAFSGAASATYVTDKGSKITLPSGPCDDERHIYSWQLIHYTNNHITFKVTQYSQYIKNNKWVNREITGYNINYNKIKYNKMVIKTTRGYTRYGWTFRGTKYIDSHYVNTSQITRTTTHSPVYVFKQAKKGMIDYIIKTGDKDW